MTAERTVHQQVALTEDSKVVSMASAMGGWRVVSTEYLMAHSQAVSMDFWTADSWARMTAGS